MTKTVSTPYNFWLSGYWDDFSSARAIADESNAANTRVLDHTKTHFGSAIGTARLNPRFHFSRPDRERTTLYASGMDAGLLHQSNWDDPTLSTAENFLKHNGSIAEWLTLDSVADKPGSYSAKAYLQYPISVCANRQRLGRETSGDHYLAFHNGHDTSGVYYAPVGGTDFSDGGSYIVGLTQQTLGVSNDISFLAGSPATHGQTGTRDDATYSQQDTGERDMTMTSIASVYAAEKPGDLTTSTYATTYSKHVVSPSKMPFLVQNTFIARGTGHTAPTTTSGTHRVLNYDGDLRIKAIGESFHLRFGYHLITDTTLSWKLNIGYTSTYDKTTNNWSTTPVIVIPMTAANLGIDGDIQTWSGGSEADPGEVWCDVEVVMDFTAGQSKAYANGSTTPFATVSHTMPGGKTFADMQGWSLDAVWAHGSTDDFVNVVTFIDRAAVALPVTNRFDGDSLILPRLGRFDMKRGANQVSTCSITLHDDFNQFNTTALTGGAITDEWSLLMFLDNEDRVHWSGVIESVSTTQSLKGAVTDTIIQARDSSSVLDRTLPVWEVGQNAAFSLTNHISMDATLAKKSAETAAIRDTLMMGATPLISRTGRLGYGKNDTDSHTSGYSGVPDGRTQLYSGNPIQMYVNEDDNGPNSVEEQWAGLGRLHDSNSTKYVRLIHVAKGTAQIEAYLLWNDPDNNPSSSISTFGPITVGGTNVILSGTSYDGTYAVADMNAAPNGKSGWVVRVKLSNTGTSGFALGDDALYRVNQVRVEDENFSDTEALYEITQHSAVAVNIGDQFRLSNMKLGYSSSRHFGMEDTFTVYAKTQTSTKFYAVGPKYGMANVSFGSASCFVYSEVLRGGHAERRAALVLPVAYKTGTPVPILDDEIEAGRAKHRNIHARWMRDLPLSPWFRAQFGEIAKTPFWRAGTGSHTHRPISPAVISTYSGFNSDGTVKTGSVLNANVAAGATSIVFDDPAMWYWSGRSGYEDFIVDLLDIKTNETDFVIGSSFSAPSSKVIAWNNTAKAFDCTGHGFDEGEVLVFDSFDDYEFNGVWVVHEVVSANQFKAWRHEGFVATRNAFAYMRDKYNGYTTGWSSDASVWFEDPDAIFGTYESYDSQSFSNQNGVAYHGTTTLSGVKGVKRAWDADATIYSLRRVDESNGYKHLFVAWADMRNDGTADADGGHRKNDFGLMLPTTRNYEVTLSFANQLDADGNLDAFTDLKVGEDVDIWSLDAAVEPFSGGAWSALDGGSNDEPLDDRFHNWEDKGGAMMLVDASRFWNLNTAATGGRTGYEQGGAVDFGDYETPTRGFPYLIDNYWLEATATYKNTDGGQKPEKHPNGRLFINDATRPVSSISAGATRVYLESTEAFDTDGIGVIICTGGSDRDAEKTLFYYRWSGKGTQTIQGLQLSYLDNVFITTLPVVTDPLDAEAQIKAKSSLYSNGSDVRIGSNEGASTKSDTNFDTVRFYNTTAALFGMRLMMSVSGLIETPNTATFFSDDKIRYLQNLATASAWTQNTVLPCISDINNVPMTRNFGSQTDARGQTFLSIVTDMAGLDGSGLDGTVASLAWLIGRDNRLDFRQSYDSKHTLNRNNLRVSNLSTQSGSKITNVRVYFNGNSDFADHPEPTGSNTRWRVLNFPDIFSRAEALALAKQEFLRESTSRISVTAEVLRDGGNIMQHNGRYGYVADVFRKAHNTKNTHDPGGRAAAWWTNRNAGHPFCGVQNALDCASASGSIKSSTDQTLALWMKNANATAVYNAAPYSTGTYAPIKFTQRTILPRTVKTNGFSLDEAYGITAALTTNASGQYVVSIGYNDGSNVYSTTSAAGPFTAAGHYEATATHASNGNVISVVFYWGGTQLSDGNNATIGSTSLFVVDGHQSRTDGVGFYGFYGANSLSYAVQVLDVQNGMPLVSATSGNELRISIAAEGTSSSPTYRLFLSDYSFANTSSAPANPTFTETLRGSSNVAITQNGVVAIQVPSSYDSSQREVLFSVNFDYLKEISRLRCNSGPVGASGTTNNGHLNANNVQGDSTYSSFSSHSLFPLGAREYSEFGDIADDRAAYYAPRLHVVNDVNYVPATTLAYTDDYLGLTNETMTIKSLNWSQDCRDVEKVRLNLEKTEKHYAYNLAAIFRPGSNGGGSGSGGPGTPHAPPLRPPIPPFRPPPGLGPSVGPLRILDNSNNIGGGSASNVGNFTGMSSNDISNLAYRNLNGRASFANDVGAGGATWGVLGAAKTGSASSFNRAIDGVDSQMASESGAAIMTSDGFTLAGVSSGDGTYAGEEQTHSINVRVPNDVSTSGIVTVEAIVTLEGSNAGEITATVECTETADSLSRAVSIPGPSTRASFVLISGNLNGAETAGNNLKVSITRTPNTGNDSAPFSSIVVHNVTVSVRRLNLPQQDMSAGSRNMLPY